MVQDDFKRANNQLIVIFVICLSRIKKFRTYQSENI